MTTSLDRRDFLRRSSSLLAGAAVLAPSLAGLVACADPSAVAFDENGIGSLASRDGYGPLAVSKDCPEISIPRGFHAVKISQSGWMMSDGRPTPQAFDGMAAFAVAPGVVRLVRNHEIRNSFADPNRRVLAPERSYDRFAPAGNTTLELRVRPNGEAELVKDFVSLSGSFVNCAGGLTPWGSWITCEETVAGTSAGWEKNHGYNFEIPAAANGPVDPVPLRAMGRFVHEAIAVDPGTGFVYQTEDRNPGGFYRFVPRVAGRLSEGGTLQVLVVNGQPGYETRIGQTMGTVLEAEWADVPNPDTDTPTISSGFVFNQLLFTPSGGTAKPLTAHFSRLEGAWWADGGCYFNATSGGNAGMGQVWKYTPTSRDAGTLALVYESPEASILKSPDNICISPRGGIVICEDGEGTNYVRGISRRGEVFDFVKNNINTSEWAGACFSPEGKTLFVNV